MEDMWDTSTDPYRSHFLIQGGGMKAETRALWEQLFTNFSQFRDFRSYKAENGGNGPDFKHTETGEGLW